ncbi:hypothetical protein ACC806_34745 [Rhizobium ruizarguesonis]
MIKFNLPVSYPETPAGKRSVKRNVFGNTAGYVAGKRFWEFGTDEKSAGFWVKGETLARAYVDCWVEGEGK